MNSKIRSRKNLTHQSSFLNLLTDSAEKWPQNQPTSKPSYRSVSASILVKVFNLTKTCRKILIGNLVAVKLSANKMGIRKKEN